MTERKIIGYKIKDAQAKYNEATQTYTYDTVFGAVIARDKNGEILFPTEDDAYNFCMIRMFFSNEVLPIYEDES